MTDGQPIRSRNINLLFHRVRGFYSAAEEAELNETGWTCERNGLAGLLTENNALNGQRSMVDDRFTRIINKNYPSPSLRHCYSVKAPALVTQHPRLLTWFSKSEIGRSLRNFDTHWDVQ